MRLRQREKTMAAFDGDAEFKEWNRLIANEMAKLASMVEKAIPWAPDGSDISFYVNFPQYLRQEAENLWPPVEGFNDPKVIPFRSR
jgi:hypothetical protein